MLKEILENIDFWDACVKSFERYLLEYPNDEVILADLEDAYTNQGLAYGAYEAYEDNFANNSLWTR